MKYLIANISVSYRNQYSNDNKREDFIVNIIYDKDKDSIYFGKIFATNHFKFYDGLRDFLYAKEQPISTFNLRIYDIEYKIQTFNYINNFKLDDDKLNQIKSLIHDDLIDVLDERISNISSNVPIKRTINILGNNSYHPYHAELLWYDLSDAFNSNIIFIYRYYFRKYHKKWSRIAYQGIVNMFNKMESDMQEFKENSEFKELEYIYQDEFESSWVNKSNLAHYTRIIDYGYFDDIIINMIYNRNFREYEHNEEFFNYMIPLMKHEFPKSYDNFYHSDNEELCELVNNLYIKNTNKILQEFIDA